MIAAGKDGTYAGEGSRVWKVLRKSVASVLSVFAGVLNALFGGGGGMLVVPALRLRGEDNQKKIHASSIAVMLPLSVLSATVFTVRKVCDYSLGLAVGVGALIGGGFGAILLKRIKSEWLSLFFYGLMIYAGIKYLQ